jgi:hypothetical protein
VALDASVYDPILPSPTWRGFSYGQAFDASDPTCSQTFSGRAFQHHDWVDGEDMVQAGRSADNDGFNYLFHNLEGDLDKVRTDISTLFACLMKQRQQLHDRLAEIQAAITGLGNAVFKTSQYISVIDPVRSKQYQVGPPPAYGDPMNNPHVLNAGNWAAYAAGNPAVNATFAGGAPVKVQDLITKFGTQPAGGGQTVADVLGILPPDATFTSADAVTGAIADREGAVLRASGADAGAIKAVLGVDPAAGGAVTAVTLDKVTTIDAGTRDKLAAAGIKNVGDLAAADPARLSGITSATTGANLAGLGRTLRGIG